MTELPGLKDIWKERENLPQLTPLGYLQQHSWHALASLMTAPFTTFLTICAISVSLVVVGSFLLLLQFGKAGIDLQTDGQKFSIFIKDETTLQTRDDLERLLAAWPGVRDLKFFDKSQAVEEFKRLLGARAVNVGDFSHNNPLPASFEITVHAGSSEKTEELAQALKARPEVDYVAYDSQLQVMLDRLVASVKRMGWWAVAIMLGLAMFIVGSTVRLALYSQRDEVEIMQLVGANPRFIEAPYLIGGFFQGLVAALLSLLVLFIGLGSVRGYLSREQIFAEVGLQISFLPWWQILLLFLCGTLPALLASYLSARRFGADR